MKQLAYVMFSVVYYIACLLPVNKDRYFCVMTHDASDDSSVGVVVKAIKKKYPNAVFTYVKRGQKAFIACRAYICKSCVSCRIRYRTYG